jgi:hypothetical protein
MNMRADPLMAIFWSSCHQQWTPYKYKWFPFEMHACDSMVKTLLTKTLFIYRLFVNYLCLSILVGRDRDNFSYWRNRDNLVPRGNLAVTSSCLSLFFASNTFNLQPIRNLRGCRPNWSIVWRTQKVIQTVNQHDFWTCLTKRPETYCRRLGRPFAVAGKPSAKSRFLLTFFCSRRSFEDAQSAEMLMLLNSWRPHVTWDDHKHHARRK